MNDTSPLEAPVASVAEGIDYVADVSFDSLGLSPELRRAVAERNYTNPTPVQAKAFKPALEGRDLIVRSKTGTGKTTAFGMPMIERIPMGTRTVKALVMCPTRELAMQVQQELESLAKYRDIKVTAIYGGASMKQQEDALDAGSAIIVGTPGRVHDHSRRGNLKLDTATMAVLDEADEMLNQGFYEEVTRILDFMPKNRQVLLFSATVPEDIQRLIAKYTTNAETLLLSGDVYTVDHITHVRYDLSDAYPKPRNLLYVLEMEAPDNAIIFCNTKDDTELVTAVLNRNGFDAELLNGDLPQKERERVMAKIKRGEVAFMVATDLAARGIDISDLGHVINYSLPEDPAVYLHRVGRTGRIGKTGVALNLCSGKELASLTSLERKYAVKFEKRDMPSAEAAEHMWADRHVKELKEASAGTIYEGFLGLAATLKKRPDADDLIASMMRYFFTHRRMDKLRASGEMPEHEIQKLETRPSRSRDERERPGSSSGGRGAERGRGRERGSSSEGRGRSRSGEREERSSARAVPNAAPTAPAVGGPAGEGAAPPPPVRERPARRESAPAGARKLSDRELFDLLQSGKPLPPIDDPTGSSGSAVTESVSAVHDNAERVERPRRERSDRPERKRREPRAEDPVEAGQARVWVNLGKMDGVADESSLQQALEAAGAPSGKVKKSEIRGSYSYVHVAEEDVGAFEGLGGKQHGEKAIKVERAKAR